MRARYELMPRGIYTYNVPTGLGAQGPRVSMAEYEKTVELYQAQNAVQIAEAQGAAQYVPDAFEKARRQYENAQQLQAGHAGRSAVVTAARQAAQTAEDARTLAATRRRDAELASARSAAERERQLRLQAEADAQRAKSEAADAQAQAVAADNALGSERNARREAEAKAAALSSLPPVVVERRVTVQHEPDAARMALRDRPLAQLSGQFEALDTGRGLVVTVPDSDFRAERRLRPPLPAALPGSP